MNILDWIVVILLGVSFLVGYQRGFIRQYVSIIGLIAAYIVAYQYYDDFAPFVGQFVPLDLFKSDTQYGDIMNSMNARQYIINAIAFALIFFGVKIALSFVGHLLNIVAKLPGLNFINKWAGALLALIECGLLIIVAIDVMMLLPQDQVKSLLDGSMTVPFLQKYAHQVFALLQTLWTQEIK